ncbi:MAG: GGDEF domain-containing protein [Sphaerochaetaceae bacterium]|nr:GGDEF domain-containing protein [Sphaerochaetaceae bacterium]
MNALVYVQVILFAVCLLAALYVCSWRKLAISHVNRRFCTIIILTICILCDDLFAWLFEGRPGSYVNGLLVFLNQIYFILTELISYFWFSYTHDVLYEDDGVEFFHKRKFAILVSIPLVVFLALLAIKPDLIFIIDQNNSYRRGRWFLIQTVVGFGYILSASVMALVRMMKEVQPEKRKTCLSLAGFIAFPLLGGVLQLSMYGTVFIWPFASASLLMVYITLHHNMVSLDRLTGLNNRSRFDNYLQARCDKPRPGRKLCLIMLDVDDFKMINDQYGHVVGDDALRCLADILKRTFHNTDSFLARYGGDEFAVVLGCRREDEARQAICSLQNAVDDVNRRKKLPSVLSVSMGYAISEPMNILTKECLLADADMEMYSQKKRKKSLTTNSR